LEINIGGKKVKQFFIDHENTKARISEWGCKGNPTIICIHGLGSTSLSFLELGELLSNKYHIFSIDLPGHGKTPPFEKDEDYGIPKLMKWLSKVIALIEQGRFYLMAHSWGGLCSSSLCSKISRKGKKDAANRWWLSC
jgi:pimeloyl-ACP methyl ester carboxylesterase